MTSKIVHVLFGLHALILLSSDTLVALESNGCLNAPCHETFTAKLQQLRFPHSAILKGTCTSCHFPHKDDNISKPVRPLNTVCYGCHKGFAARIGASTYVHDPILQDQCQACHNPHGSNNSRLLTLNYPVEYYLSYSDSNYDLCWKCHNREMTTGPKNWSATLFRNGDHNLHFFHVNARKGRSCKVCHEIHAGNKPILLGGKRNCFDNPMKMPIQHTRTTTGGRCVVGCHREMSYDRDNPVQYNP